MGTARTSPKVVRERRAKGIQPNRGKQKRHFPKAQRNDRHLERAVAAAKRWNPEPLETVVERLVRKSGAPEALIEDLRQELWVRLLEGQGESAIADDLDILVSDVKKAVWGDYTISLETTYSNHKSEALPFTLGDFIDQDGKFRRGTGRGLASRDGFFDRRGIPHSPETKRLMSKRRAHLWAGPYGEERRKALGCATKVCRKCGYSGSWENFAKNPNCYGGVDKICKPCMSAQTQTYKRLRKQRQQSVAA